MQFKAGVTSSGRGGVDGKGEGLSFELNGGKRFGRGKENVPPAKNENQAEGSRKRLRVGRARSGSIASMRSSEGGTSAPSLIWYMLIIPRLPSVRRAFLVVFFLPPVPPSVARALFRDDPIIRLDDLY